MLLKKLFKYRFELFFYSSIIILFGSLIFPKQVLNSVIMPLLFVLNIASGLVIFKKRKRQTLVVIGMLTLVSFVFFYRLVSKSEERILEYIRFFVYFGFEGWMLTALTSGMSPVTNLFDALTQVSLMSLFRFVSLFYLNDFWRIIQSFQSDGKKKNSNNNENEKSKPE